MAVSDRRSARTQALFCVAVFLVAVAVCYPVAEIGIYDDWSYVRTAELLAQTGHVHYNGWATAMLGWQLYPAALCFRLFGFSFTVARLTTVAVAAWTVYLVHRCCTRLGCMPWNATLATLTLVLTPLFLPLATTFMSDMFGLWAVVACLYCCVRAVEAGQSRDVAWLVAGVVVSTVGGTARQIAWLGVLVMVPSAVLLLWRERRVRWIGAVCWVAGAGSIFGFMRWFAHQPYAVPDIFPHAILNATVVETCVVNLLRLALESCMLILPLLVAFYPVLAASRRRLALVLAAVAVLGGVAVVAHRFVHHLGQFPVPTLLDGGNYVSPQGVLTAWPEHGARPTLLSDPLRVCFTLAVLAGVLAVVWMLSDERRVSASLSSASSAQPGTKVEWRRVLMLTGPFSACYVLLLTPRSAFFHPYDRYSLPLLVTGVLWLALFYQQRLGARLPATVVGLLAVFGTYSVATTHDAFAMYRGSLKAMNEVMAAGVSPTAIDGGWDYDGWTQVTQDRFVHDLRLRLPGETGPSEPDTRACHFDLQYLFPVVHPVYALAFEPDLCGGPTSFAPVVYRSWLPWRLQTIYVVRDAPGGQ